jgi:hypothetical protein
MNWKQRIYESLTEAQFGPRKPKGKRSGTQAKTAGTRNVAKKAAMTHPSKRTPAQQKAYEKARKKYQTTGETPFRSGRAWRQEQNIKQAGLGDAPSKRKRGKK